VVLSEGVVLSESTSGNVRAFVPPQPRGEN